MRYWPKVVHAQKRINLVEPHTPRSPEVKGIYSEAGHLGYEGAVALAYDLLCCPRMTDTLQRSVTTEI